VPNAGHVAAIIVDGCIAAFGRIDVLHNNVGIVEVGGAVETSEERRSLDRVSDYPAATKAAGILFTRVIALRCTRSDNFLRCVFPASTGTQMRQSGQAGGFHGGRKRYVGFLLPSQKYSALNWSICLSLSTSARS
jgi:hypothetical protein